MSTQETIEERLAVLEKDVAALKAKLQVKNANTDMKEWLDSVVGSMAEFAEWGEVCRLGKELGNAQSSDQD